jgi:hypothetical protein
MRRGILTFILLMASGGAALAQSVGFDLSGGTSFSTGEVVDLTVVANGFSNGLSIGGLNLQFDSSVLTLQSVSIDAAFDQSSTSGAYAPPSIDNVAGNVTGVDFAAILNLPPTGSTIDIATFQFIAGGPGTSSLSLSNDDAFGTSYFDGAYNPLNPGVDFQFASSSVSVSSMVAPVPEPPTAVLLAAAALFGFSARAVLRRRDRLLG